LLDFHVIRRLISCNMLHDVIRRSSPLAGSLFSDVAATAAPSRRRFSPFSPFFFFTPRRFDDYA